MPYTAIAADLMLDALDESASGGITHVGLLDADTGKALTTPFGVAATDIFTATAHGYAAGDLVVFSGLTGGAGIFAGRPYFVIAANLAANTFSVSEKPGGASINFTSDVSAGTVTRLVELSGGSPAYARKSIAFTAASMRFKDDSTNGAVVDVAAGAVVDYISFHSAVTGGNLHAIAPVTPESFAAQGTYTVTDADLDLNAVA